MAIRESIFGEAAKRVLKPTRKNLKLINTTGITSNKSVSEKIIAFSTPRKISGSGQPIICPMEIYESGTANTSESFRRFFTASYSCRAISFAEACIDLEALPCCAASFSDAPYPASVTAPIIFCVSSAVSSYSTTMLFFNKLTAILSTPGSLPTAFSTRALQAAQVMPVTLNCSFFIALLLI